MEKLYQRFDGCFLTQGLVLIFQILLIRIIDYHILLAKLVHDNFSRKSVNVFKSCVQNGQQFVKTEVAGSENLTITTGVAQGSVLGPTLFSFYNYDLVHVSPDLDCSLFADDTEIFSTDPTAVNHELAKIES